MKTLSFRTVIAFSFERLWSVVRPLSAMQSNIPIVRRTWIVEVTLFFLAIIFALSYLATNYYYMHVDDGVRPMQEQLTPGLLRWYTLQSDAEVQ